MYRIIDMGGGNWYGVEMLKDGRTLQDEFEEFEEMLNTSQTLYIVNTIEDFEEENGVEVTLIERE